jgi:TonB-linked SusC/RagA family outer membrane protein
MNYIKYFTIKKIRLFLTVFTVLSIPLMLNAATDKKLNKTESLDVSQQEIVITGSVIDESGEVLAGVTVIVKGSSKGTITDVDGKYTISVPNQNSKLVFSYIGYKSVELTIGDSKSINITLKEDALEMSEVVVVGYGTMKKGSLTGAVAQYNAEKLMERPIQRLDQALVGQMAGVHVKQTSGMPGAGLKVQVRGTGSISANSEPLYVIDGFPLDVASQNSSGRYLTGSPLDNMNPNDIESVQVLKDASAAAIYGSRASNGVVLITTKQGQSGKAKINFNYYTGWNEPVRHLEMLNGEQWIDRAVETLNYNYLKGDNGTQNRSVNDDYDTRVANIGSFNREMIPDPRWFQDGHPGITFVDWQDEIFRKGLMSNYQLSASGANDFVKYFVSADYLDQEGFTIGVGYKRYSARANVEVNVNKKLTFGINLSPSYSVRNDPGVEGKDNQFHIAVSTPPVVEDATGGIYYNVGANPSYTWGNNRNSPVAVLENTTGETKVFRTLGTLFGELEIINGLRLRTTLNLDNLDQRYKYYRPAKVSGTPVARTAGGQFVGFNKQTFVNENTLSYNHTFAEKHNVAAVAGFSYNVNSLNNFQMHGSGGFGTDYITTLNDANGINATQSYTLESKNVLISYFGRVNYDYLGRYLLSASIRRDGSSRFGYNTKWGVFPAASIGWRLSEEKFMENIDWLSSLKMRASWGISGNNGLGGDYEHIALLESAYYTFGGNQAVGMVPKNIANKDLSWEEAETYNFGLDFGFLKNRIYGSVEYYTKLNTDLLLQINVPATTGFRTALTNIGAVRNQGLEIELNTHNIKAPFSWTTGFNISFNKNEVKHLGPNDSPILGTTSFDISHNILQVGQPMYSIFVVKQDGILTQEDIDNKVALYGTQTVGDPKYVDADKDGAITPNDRVICGHPNPDFIWGLTNTFNYKNFDLSIFVQGQHGGKIYSMFGRAVDRTGMGWLDNGIVAWDDRWRSPENPGAGSKGKIYSSFGRIKNTDWLYSSDYWRIRNITFGYNLEGKYKPKFIQGARIYLSAENWFGKDKYTGGANPEAVNTEGDDYGGIPLAKSIIFGVNLTF